MNDVLCVDIETYSDVDLSKCGVYRYASSPAFEILLLGVSINYGPVIVYDLASGETVPESLVEAIAGNDTIKIAHNASFERICLSQWIRSRYPRFFHSYGSPDDTVSTFLDPVSWQCSMVMAAYCGLPLSLGDAGAALGLDKQKMTEGKDLIRYFCVPCKPTKANGGRRRNLPSDAPDKWSVFKAYNQRDVETEMGIIEKLREFAPPDQVWAEYHQSEMINDRGIRIDRQLVENAIRIDAITKEHLTSRMKEHTGLDNPNSVQQLTGWLSSKGVAVSSLGKKDVAAMIPETPPEVSDILRMRQQLAKSSVKKYQAMLETTGDDDRCRGNFQFYGANRTGRFSGRRIQLQNCPQNHMPDLSEARELVRQGDFEMLDLLYDNIPDVLSQLIRTAIIPRDGMKFIVSDFSAIEARVLSYLADEKWRIDTFRNNGDIYCASASQMFKVPVEKHGVNSHLRMKGKIAELALGYGGSTGALLSMGALEMGLSEDDLPELVQSWRSANPHIVRYWWKVGNAAVSVIKTHKPAKVGPIMFLWQDGKMFVELPSGRHLSYISPAITKNRFGGESITYMGLDMAKHWSRIESYGSKIVENIVQGYARDILCFSINSLFQYYIIGSVHDELIIETPVDTSVEHICSIMGQTPPWAPGLPLQADGYECSFYMKS